MPSRNIQDMPKTGKIIALDVGQKTVGIAISDKLRRIASPGRTINRVKWSKDKEILQKLITEHQAAFIVVGYPLSMHGDVTPQTKSCYSFAENIERDLGMPTLLWDERLTTQAATTALFEQRTGRQTRASKKDVKAQVDSVAASLILQGVLDALRHTRTTQENISTSEHE